MSGIATPSATETLLGYALANWVEGEISRVIKFEKNPIEKIRKAIVQHHATKEEPYFYSVKVEPIDVALLEKAQGKELSQERQRFMLAVFACAGAALLFFWKTRSYAESLGVCLTAFHAFVVGHALYRPQEIDYPRYHVTIERSDDKRICPSNFDITRDSDPLTQEMLSKIKLHSSQMIYLPNYVTEAKSFVRAVLVAGNVDFRDPAYLREFTSEEQKTIFSQIEKIFLISKEKFNECFKRAEEMEDSFDHLLPARFYTDKRVFIEQGRLAKGAKDSLQELANNLPEDDLLCGNIKDWLASDEEFAKLPSEQRNSLEVSHKMRQMQMNALESAGYIANLKLEDKVKWRIAVFEAATGFSLTAQ